MAYFSNGSEGMVFEDQCSKCKLGDKYCPIAWIQMDCNYEQHKDTTGTATKILNSLVSQDGKCIMFQLLKSDLEIDPNQLKLF